jgi:hypothetical protein
MCGGGCHEFDGSSRSRDARYRPTQEKKNHSQEQTNTQQSSS